MPPMMSIRKMMSTAHNNNNDDDDAGEPEQILNVSDDTRTSPGTATETTPASTSTERKRSPIPCRDAEIQKAVKFWNHPSLIAIPTQEKINYLKAKGLSDLDIHQVWEKLVNNDHDHDSTHRYHDTGRAMGGSGEASQPAIPSSSVLPGHRTTGPSHNVLGPPRPPSQEDDAAVYDETLPTVALLTVGGLLGLTAAAAVRWLNGGDFSLLPPATTTRTTVDTPSSTHKGHSRIHTTTNHQSGDSDTEEDQHDDDNQQDKSNSNVRRHDVLSKQIQELTTLVQAQNESYDRLVQSWTAHQAKRMTDQSMTLLKRSQQIETIQALLKPFLPHDKDGNLKQAIAMLNDYLEDDKEETALQHPPQRPDEVMVTLDYRSTDGNAIWATTERTQVEAVPSPPHPSSHASLRHAIQQLVLDNDNTTDLHSGCQVLYLYVTHLSSHPHVPRYRKIYTSNGSFQKVEKLAGGLELLQAVGFVNRDGYLEWQPEHEPEATKALQAASAALSTLKSNTSSDGMGGVGEAPNKESLCAMVLATLPTRSGTPTYSSTTLNDEDEHIIHNDIVTTPLTPQVGDHLISPPVMKKHPNAVVHSFLPTPYTYPNTPIHRTNDQKPTHEEVSSSAEILHPESSSQGTSQDHVMMEQLPITAFQPILSQSEPPAMMQPSPHEE